MNEIFEYYMSTPLFSYRFFVFALVYLVVNAVTLLTALRVVGREVSLVRFLCASFVLTVISVTIRRFVLPPYSMVGVHVVALLVAWTFFKITFLQSFLGIFFSMFLMTMGTVLIILNLSILTGFKHDFVMNIPVYSLLSCSEVFFNLLYIVLSYKYPNLNLGFIFEARGLNDGQRPQ